MLLKLNKTPKFGEERVVKKFAFFPVRCGASDGRYFNYTGEILWWEYYEEIQSWWEDRYAFFGRKRKWVTVAKQLITGVRQLGE